MAARKNTLTELDDMTAYGQKRFFTAAVNHPCYCATVTPSGTGSRSVLVHTGEALPSLALSTRQRPPADAAAPAYTARRNTLAISEFSTTSTCYGQCFWSRCMRKGMALQKCCSILYCCAHMRGAIKRPYNDARTHPKEAQDQSTHERQMPHIAHENPCVFCTPRKMLQGEL